MSKPKRRTDTRGQIAKAMRDVDQDAIASMIASMIANMVGGVSRALRESSASIASGSRESPASRAESATSRGAIGRILAWVADALEDEDDDNDKASVDARIPSELWMLWRVANDDHDEGWVCSLDGGLGIESYLAFPSREIAMGCASDYRAKHDIECYPVRVHPALGIRT